MGDDLGALLHRTEAALEESVKLQSHYAKVLNLRDGGGRMTFATGQSWIERLLFLEEHPDAEHAPQSRDFI
jgi:hypothetical protein